MKISHLAVLCTLVTSTIPALAAAEACTVADIQGDAVTLWRNGEAIPLSGALVLSNQDRIQTGSGTTVNLLCANDVRVTIGPETDIQLSAVTATDESWSAFLMDGAAWFARPFFSEDRFEVRTPSAVASVRSTEWFVEVANEATAVFVDEGGVMVNALRGNALVNAGLGIDITAEGAVGPVKTWGAGRVHTMRERLGFPAE